MEKQLENLLEEQKKVALQYQQIHGEYSCYVSLHHTCACRLAYR